MKSLYIVSGYYCVCRFLTVIIIVVALSLDAADSSTDAPNVLETGGKILAILCWWTLRSQPGVFLRCGCIYDRDHRDNGDYGARCNQYFRLINVCSVATFIASSFSLGYISLTSSSCVTSNIVLDFSLNNTLCFFALV